LLNQRVVITGGGSGIGKAASLAFAKQGALVNIIDLSKEQGQEVADIIIQGGIKAIAHSCDVSNHQEVAEVFQNIGTIDVLVNNAGIAHIGKAHDTSEKEFDQVYNVNVKGIYNCLHAAIPSMQQNGGGVILNMCSISAHAGLSDRFAYSMSKGAVYAMTLSVAKDYITDGIRCNCVSPARVHTAFVDNFIRKNYPGKEKEMFEKLSKSQPIGRMAKPEEVAHLILYLCSEEASFITGCDYSFDGGFLKLNN
jgi:NAD(P)-dependent dehydrogenase (short-subunit alcohol dehydrogenase family)